MRATLVLAMILIVTGTAGADGPNRPRNMGAFGHPVGNGPSATKSPLDKFQVAQGTKPQKSASMAQAVEKSAHNELPRKTVKVRRVPTRKGDRSSGAPAKTRNDKKRVTLALCATAHDVTSRDWSKNLQVTVRQVLGMGHYPANLEVLFSRTAEPCGEVLFGCQAEPKSILCSEQSINRLLQAAAWLAAHDTQQMMRLNQAPLEQVLQEVGQMDFKAALELSDAYNSGDSRKILALVNHYNLSDELIDIATAVQKAGTDPHFQHGPPAVMIAGSIYSVAATELMGLILGHEFAHAIGKCHVDTLSVAERSGLLDRLVSMQARGDGFIRAAPMLDEIMADACALRVLEQVDAGWVALDNSTPDPSTRALAKETTSVGRWIALDGLAALFSTSLSRRSTSGPADYHPGLYVVGPEGTLVAVESEGYLYPASRLALAATILHGCQARDDPQKEVVLCEFAARQFVTMLHVAGDMQKGSKSPEFADLFGPIIAPGVVEGLRTGLWREVDPGSSYKCGK